MEFYGFEIFILSMSVGTSSSVYLGNICFHTVTNVIHFCVYYYQNFYGGLDLLFFKMQLVTCLSFTLLCKCVILNQIISLKQPAGCYWSGIPGYFLLLSLIS